MKPQEIEKWKKIREKGMPRFILTTGIISFGIPMFVILNLFDPSKKPLSVVDYAVLFVLCAVVGGSAFGYIMWRVQESRYLKASKENA